MRNVNKPKTLAAWMVVDAHGKPVLEKMAWGKNIVIGKTRSEVCIWKHGERVVKVKIRWKHKVKEPVKL